MKINNINRIFLACSIASMTYFLWEFFRPHEVPVELCKIIEDGANEGNRDYYCFIQDESEIANYFFPHEYYTMMHGKSVADIDKGRIMVDSICGRFSYMLVYGRKVKSLKYSVKSSFFDDPSPDYCSARRKLEKFAVIEYDGEPNTDIYIYRVKKDYSLTGISGL